MYMSIYFFFFKQKTAYEVRIGDWSSDVCSSDLQVRMAAYGVEQRTRVAAPAVDAAGVDDAQQVALGPAAMFHRFSADGLVRRIVAVVDHGDGLAVAGTIGFGPGLQHRRQRRCLTHDAAFGPALQPAAPPGRRIVGVVRPVVAELDDEGNAGGPGEQIADEERGKGRCRGEDGIRAPVLEEAERTAPRRRQPADPVVGKIEQQLIELGEIAAVVGGIRRWRLVARCRRSGSGLPGGRSEEHTSELPSLMRISYAVFCLK